MAAGYRGLETVRLQPAGVTGGVLGTVHRERLRLSVVQRCLSPDTQGQSDSILHA